MKIRSEYRLREMAGEHVVVIPGAAETAAPTRILALNDSARYLWERFLGRDFDEELIAGALAERYDVDPSVARNDARGWIERLEACGILEE